MRSIACAQRSKGEQVRINPELENKDGAPPRWWNAVIPIGLIIVLVFLALILTGVDVVEADGLPMNIENVRRWAAFCVVPGIHSVRLWLLLRFRAIPVLWAAPVTLAESTAAFLSVLQHMRRCFMDAALLPIRAGTYSAAKAAITSACPAVHVFAKRHSYSTLLLTMCKASSPSQRHDKVSMRCCAGVWQW